MARWEKARRWAVILAIGGLAAWLWIRLGLYGFGLAVGIAFAATIHTGTFCSYRPDPRVAAYWEL